MPGISSGFGFNSACGTLSAGKSACFAASSEDALWLIGTFDVDTVIASPLQALSLAEIQEKKTRLPLTSLKTLTISGAKAPPEMIQRLRSHVCRKIVICYASTEAGTAASAPYEVVEDIPDAAGFVPPDVELEIVDEAGAPLPTGSDGLIRLRTPYLLLNREANGPASGSQDDEFWFYPGDVGHLTEHGILCVTGRSSDVINSGGIKVSATKIEEIVQALPEIREAAACGVMGPAGIEEVWIAVVAQAAVDVAEIKRLLKAHNEVKIEPAEVFVLDQLPRGELRQDSEIPAEGAVAQPQEGRLGSCTSSTWSISGRARRPDGRPSFSTTKSSPTWRWRRGSKALRSILHRVSWTNRNRSLFRFIPLPRCWWRAWACSAPASASSPPPSRSSGTLRLATPIRWSMTGRRDARGAHQHPVRQVLACVRRECLTDREAAAPVENQRQRYISSSRPARPGGRSESLRTQKAWEQRILFNSTSAFTDYERALTRHRPGERLWLHPRLRGALCGKDHLFFACRAIHAVAGQHLRHRPDYRVSPAGAHARGYPGEGYPLPARRLEDGEARRCRTIRRDGIDRIRNHLCRNVVIAYSSTEAGTVATAPYDMIADIPGAVGFVIPGGRGQIVDATDQVLPIGSEGFVRVRSKQFLLNFSVENPSTWFYPGDFGWLTQDGVLCIAGRKGDIVNRGGVKLSVPDLENFLLSCPGVADAGVCTLMGTSGYEEVWVALVFAPSIDMSVLRQRIDFERGIGRNIDQLFVVETIPRGQFGKIQREQLKEMLQSINEDAMSPSSA